MKEKNEISKRVYKSKYSKEYIKEHIKQCVFDFSNQTKEFLYKDQGDDEIRIGIEKGDPAGWWYIATLTNCKDGCIIDREIQYDPDHYTTRANDKESMFSKIIYAVFLGIIFIIFCIPILIAYICLTFKKNKTKEEYLDDFLKEYLLCEKIKG